MVDAIFNSGQANAMKSNCTATANIEQEQSRLVINLECYADGPAEGFSHPFKPRSNQEQFDFEAERKFKLLYFAWRLRYRPYRSLS